MATVLRKSQQLAVSSPKKPGNWSGMATGVYTLWLKHMRKFRSSTMELGGTLATPILWMLLFGVCMEGMVKELNLGMSYQAYITPGIMLLTSLTAAVLGGATLMIERINGVIKEYLVAPIPRLAVLLGTMASGLTKAIIQAVVVLLMSFVLGVTLHTDFSGLLVGILLVGVYSLGFVGIAAAVACQSKSMESYHTLIMLMNLPVLFLSNAIYPLHEMPIQLRSLAYLNPTTYAADAIRGLFFGGQLEIGLWIDIPVLLAFMVAGLWYGYRSFQKTVANPAG
jgi:ABC-2 type transport system permease protein